MKLRHVRRAQIKHRETYDRYRILRGLRGLSGPLGDEAFWRYMTDLEETNYVPASILAADNKLARHWSEYATRSATSWGATRRFAWCRHPPPPEVTIL